MSPGKAVLLVEWRTFDRDILTEALRECGFEVKSFSEPGQVKKEDADQAGALVTHVHFPDKNGDQDYQVAADLCARVATWRGEELPVIGLSTRRFDKEYWDCLAKYAFPDRLRRCETYDPRKLVGIVRETVGKHPAVA